MLGLLSLFVLGALAIPDRVPIRGGGLMPVVSNGAVTPLNAKYDAEEAAALEEWIRLGGRGVSGHFTHKLPTSAFRGVPWCHSIAMIP